MDGFGIGAGFSIEANIASWSGVSELYSYLMFSYNLFDSEEHTAGNGLDVEYGFLRRWYMAGPFFVGAGAGLNVGYYPSTKPTVGAEDPLESADVDGEGSIFAGAAAHMHLGFLITPSFLIDVRAGYRAGLVHHLGRSDQKFDGGLVAGLGLMFEF
jgi:hypothetical protein